VCILYFLFYSTIVDFCIWDFYTVGITALPSRRATEIVGGRQWHIYNVRKGGGGQESGRWKAPGVVQGQSPGRRSPDAEACLLMNA